MMLLMFVLGSIIGNLVALLLTPILGAGSEYATLIAYPIMFIPAMMYTRIKSRNASIFSEGVKLDSANFGGHSIATLIPLVALATWALAFCVDAPMSIMPPMPEWLEKALESITQGTFWVNFLCVSIFAPFFEEWLCRGIILRGLLSRRKHPAFAIIISAVFFAVIHANPWQAIPAFLLGCLFGYIYYKTGSLVLTMIMHFANNTLSLVLSQFSSLQEYDNFRDMLPAQSYWSIFAACVLLLVLIIRVFRRIPLVSPEGNMDKIGNIYNTEV